MPHVDARRRAARLEHAGDGRYRFLVALRKGQGGNAPKVIFCTTENDVEHINRAISAGANEYIMKPFDRDIIEAKFHEVGLI
jgi:two-component system chemotaxis response regulator CheY